MSIWLPKYACGVSHVLYFNSIFSLQVLSETVSKALILTGGAEATETAKFAAMFDKFFDVLNVSNFSNGWKARKPFQLPFYNAEDKRLEVNL